MDSPLLSVHNDRLYLGWVFLRSSIFSETAADVQRLCYEFVNQRAVIPIYHGTVSVDEAGDGRQSTAKTNGSLGEEVSRD